MADLTCYIVDDEFHGIEVLTDYIKDTPGLNLIGSSTNPLEALKEITTQKPPDIVFSDIDMPQLNGIQFIELIPEPSIVVFTTAFGHYAVQAFEKEAFDYLLKPITYKRFLDCIQKIRKNMISLKEEKPENSGAGHIYIKGDSKGKLIRINYDEIFYIEASQNYVLIHLNKISFKTYLTLNEIAKQLPENQFSRVHKSYIINNEKIKLIETGQLTLKNDKIVMIGNTYKPVLHDRIGMKLLKTKRTN